MKKMLLAALGLAFLAAPAFADPVQIKFAYPSAPNNALFQAMQSWADDVNKAANGVIDVKLFPGGAHVLAAFRAELTAMRAGK